MGGTDPIDARSSMPHVLCALVFTGSGRSENSGRVRRTNTAIASGYGEMLDHRNFSGSFSGGGGATSARFHQPPPSATNSAAVSAYWVARAPAAVTSADR